MAPVVDALRPHAPEIETRVAFTGQHTTLVDRVLGAFSLRADYDLAIMRDDQTLYDVVHRALDGLREVVRDFRPDAILVQGDTATVFVASLVGFFERVPVGHVEAGLRSGDRAAPVSRRGSPPDDRCGRGMALRTHHASARRAARRERPGRHGVRDRKHGRRRPPLRLRRAPGLQRPHAARRHRRLRANARPPHRAPSRVVRCGTPPGLRRGPCAGRRASGDRRRLPGPPQSERPRTGGGASSPGTRAFTSRTPSTISIWSVRWSGRSSCSRTRAASRKRPPTFGVPVLVLRDVTERPEGIEAGVARLVGTDPDTILRAARDVLEAPPRSTVTRNPYGDGAAGARIADILVSALTGRPRTTRDWAG